MCVKKGKVFFKKQSGVQSFKTSFCGKTKTINFFEGEKKLVVDGQSFYGAKSIDIKLFKKFNQFDVYG